jgi:hypothetical protein
MTRTRTFWALPVFLFLARLAAAGQDPPQPLPYYLQDRGTGVPSSIFGTYIRGGELVLYPFVEYYHDDDLEYSPEEFGYDDMMDYRARYRAYEGLFFLGYGITDDLAFEFEAATIDAEFTKSRDDTSDVPGFLEESGLGDVEAQLRWRWKRETETRPELFSYFEVVFPHSEDKVLIGTPGWQLKAGTGIVRGFHWGTLTARIAVEYDEASTSSFDLGEYAIEYLKRVSPALRFFVALEGSSDELSLITEVQWFATSNIILKANSGIGLTSKATDWAPEAGVMFILPTR